jgi:dihydrofolate reductase
MTISSIVAFSDNMVIGIDNDLPWRLSNDLKYFKKTTTNHTIIMGRKTFESIGKPLPNRENIIITRNKDYKVDGARCFHSVATAIEYCEGKAKDEIFFIGGAQIYSECLKWSNKLYITKVHTTIENGTAFFPTFEKAHWELESTSDKQLADEKNEYNHTFEIYTKK